MMILGVLSAQFISLAHACMIAPDAMLPGSAVAQHAAAMPPDCAMMAHGAAANDAACDMHCFPQEQADRGADLRLPAMAPPSVFVIRVVSAVVPQSAIAARPLARIASPPLSLLFRRFLI
jgi:hypothetical protein